ncbi:K(+)-transporting ATPase subunit C [Epilithonimonas lactis]|uniref:Potassium-transporting ATPase KdpC subunit n=1 Tax=Epilithonimonas lactis TaxID=421072 RepID=A0A085B7D6_9FLAO|nr:K(+)-transporting ATPase subunit C [Epilithonimonas lactis]KFC18381.1 potassium-transporting ATPase subunit C [Epilithonimonas lactis]SER03020.1 K+-transporting ATPase ATPase C chain [Epilithonimonas lactis]
MKQHILPALKLTLVCLLFFSGFYTLIIFGIAQFSPNDGKGEIITVGNKKYYTNVGQAFTEDQYFWSRPSAVDYNAAGAAGSNKGPSNPDYLKTVQERIDNFIKHNPEVSKSEIPSDLVTASGSGLDPNISVQAADVQVKRIAKIRNLNENKIQDLVASNTEKPFLGLFGTEKINVLKLNIALDGLK